MLYIFVINGREDKSFIKQDIEAQVAGLQIDYKIYSTVGNGDATRYVRLYCKFHENEEVCFIACGGSGTANEVASGLVGFKNKFMAVLTYGVTNDFTKNFPDRDFNSVKDIVNGEKKRIDIIRCNDDYCINIINIGFDAMVAYEGENYDGSNKYWKGLVKAILGHRYHNLKVYVDGEKVSRGMTLLCGVCNGKICGGGYLYGPNAIIDDGLIDFCLLKGMTLLEMLLLLPIFFKGEHLGSKFWKRKIVYRQCKHIEISSKDLIVVCLDGEIVESTNLTIDILEKELGLILPAKAN